MQQSKKAWSWCLGFLDLNTAWIRLCAAEDRSHRTVKLGPNYSDSGNLSTTMTDFSNS